MDPQILAQAQQRHAEIMSRAGLGLPTTLYVMFGVMFVVVAFVMIRQLKVQSLERTLRYQMAAIQALRSGPGTSSSSSSKEDPTSLSDDGTLLNPPSGGPHGPRIGETEAEVDLVAMLEFLD